MSDARPRQTVPKIRARKGGEPIVCLTAYTAPIARLIDPYVDLLLVGDSSAVVVHGHETTIPITLEEIITSARAVMRVAPRALVVVDMPFGSYEGAKETAHANAVRILKETGADAVKVEGGRFLFETISYLTERAVPVMAHIGLRPQSALALGGYPTVGRDRASWPQLLEDAKAVDKAGAFAVVLESVVEELAAEITRAIAIPTIGIGASAACDGQILVTDDMLGVFERSAKFVRAYANLRKVIAEAVGSYAADVRARRFPGPSEVYKPKT